MAIQRKQEKIGCDQVAPGDIIISSIGRVLVTGVEERQGSRVFIVDVDETTTRLLRLRSSLVTIETLQSVP